ncbi:hypothetical protein [Saccharothrix violaceirubra]|uniref:PknH-like protein n=1 Tax=Saccharothrix violaceirubra TaxID=413306 RepID=A0A7W7T4Z9_9PSEU|nr:hypothetical protein [Saccharothrix violaceirubra]MBB4966683.1 hypothetical protein [Saccharothrix violaceirubra]
MRRAGLLLAALLLTGCTTALPGTARPGPLPTPTPTFDLATTEKRVRAARLPDADMLGEGWQPEEVPFEGGGGYAIVPCPVPLSTEGAQSTAWTLHRWTRAEGTLAQHIVPYRRPGAGVETIEDARATLKCGTFRFAELTYTVLDEVKLPSLGADAQFAVCYDRDPWIMCTLLLVRADLLVSLTLYTTSEEKGATELERLGRVAAPLLEP